MSTDMERTKAALDMARKNLASMASYSGTFAEQCKNVLKHMDLILNPPPEMETVELTTWAIVAPSGFVETTSGNEELQRDQVANENSPFYGYQVAKLTGPLTRPKKQLVERSVQVTLCRGGDWYVRGESIKDMPIELDGTFTYPEDV